MKFNLKFLLTIIALFLLGGGADHIDVRPQGPHQWRQSDCVSFTLNYAEDDLPLMEPQIHNWMSDGGTSGRTSGEFPILYYAVGQVWKVTGQNEMLFRVINLGIFILGLWALFHAIRPFIRHTSAAITAAALPMTIPVLAYYAPNFLQNITALSFVFIAWFFAVRFYQRKSLIWALLAIVAFALAGLLKITGLISFIALMGTLFFDALGSGKIRKELGSPVRFWTLFAMAGVIVIGSTAAWYEYSRWYCTTHGGWFTFNDLWPVWKSEPGYIRETLSFVWKTWLKEYFTPVHYLILFFSALFVIFRFRKLSFFEKSMVALLFVGNLTYLLLWFKAIQNHDYYFINLYALPLLLWIIAAVHFSRHSPVALQSRFLGIFFGLVLIASALYTHKSMDRRYNGWMNDGGTNRYSSFFDVTPYLRDELKIDRKTPVMTYPDGSYCITLYLADQVGWPMSRQTTVPDFMNHIENHGAQYILVNDDDAFRKMENFGRLPIVRIGEHGKVVVYQVVTPSGTGITDPASLP